MSEPVNSTVKVFISYAHTDHIFAEALRQVLVEINRSRVECFLDTESIRSGEGWEQRLEDALKDADWLVCVYTGEQSDYCGYEVGVFTGGKGLSHPAADIRLVCLHDVADPPGLFRKRQNKLVRFPTLNMPTAQLYTAAAGWSSDERTFYRESPVFQFLQDMCIYQDLYIVQGPDDTERQTNVLLEGAKRITNAFKAARASDIKSDTPTQLGLEISFAAPAGALNAVPNEAVVTGTFGTFKLFGLMPPMEHRQLPVSTWQELRRINLKSPTRMICGWICWRKTW